MIFKIILSLLFLLISSIQEPKSISVECAGSDKEASRITDRIFYDELALEGIMVLPSYEVFSIALKGYNNLKNKSGIRKNILTIVDFSMPSSEKRLWVIDVETRKVLFNDLVAHGRNSGDDIATEFSNTPNTNMSSIGFFITGETYTGMHGLSLYLDGMDKDFNNNARSRAIVIHGADYVSLDFIKKYGRLGRSFGCPSLSLDIYKPVINTICDGSCLFIYYPDQEFLNKSSVLNS